MPDLGLSAITRNPFPDWPHLHCCAPNHSKLQSSILPCNVKLKESYIQWGGCHIFTAVSHAKPYRLNVSVHWCILIEILTIWIARPSIFCKWQNAMLLESVVLLYGVFSFANENFQFDHLFFPLSLSIWSNTYLPMGFAYFLLWRLCPLYNEKRCCVKEAIILTVKIW